MERTPEIVKGTLDLLVLKALSWGPAHGYTVARSIAYAYVPAVHAAPGTRVEVEIFGSWVPGTIAAEPLYDPAGERIRS